MAKNQRDFFKKKNEWSEIKDTLLRCYLPQYFQKLLVSGKPIFYIDCFAGKGKFDDGNDGSPLIAMQIINERLGMSRISRKNNAIVPCFIELNHAADLEQNLMLHPYQYGTPQVVDGKFEDNIRGLLKDKRGYMSSFTLTHMEYKHLIRSSLMRLAHTDFVPLRCSSISIPLVSSEMPAV